MKVVLGGSMIRVSFMPAQASRRVLRLSYLAPSTMSAQWMRSAPLGVKANWVLAMWARKLVQEVYLGSKNLPLRDKWDRAALPGSARGRAGQERPTVMIEPPGDARRRRIFEVNDGVLVAREIALFKQRAGAMHQPCSRNPRPCRCTRGENA